MAGRIDLMRLHRNIDALRNISGWPGIFKPKMKEIAQVSAGGMLNADRFKAEATGRITTSAVIDAQDAVRFGIDSLHSWLRRRRVAPSLRQANGPNQEAVPRHTERPGSGRAIRYS